LLLLRREERGMGKARRLYRLRRRSVEWFSVNERKESWRK